MQATDRREVINLLVAFNARYGYRMANRSDAQRAAWLHEWDRATKGMTAEDFERGLNRLSDREDAKWPPSADEFVALCRAKPLTGAHKPFRGLERRYRSNEAVALEALSKIKQEISGGSA